MIVFQVYYLTHELLVSQTRNLDNISRAILKLTLITLIHLLFVTSSYNVVALGTSMMVKQSAKNLAVWLVDYYKSISWLISPKYFWMTTQFVEGLITSHLRNKFYRFCRNFIAILLFLKKFRTLFWRLIYPSQFVTL